MANLIQRGPYQGFLKMILAALVFVLVLTGGPLGTAA
jgi:hypothetical protein